MQVKVDALSPLSDDDRDLDLDAEVDDAPGEPASSMSCIESVGAAQTTTKNRSQNRRAQHAVPR